MGIINNLLKSFVVSKLGENFEEKVMETLENQITNTAYTIDEIVEHYQEILKILKPDYETVKLDANDLLMITIDGIEYELDGKSNSKSRKITEHRMAIEALFADLGEACADVFKDIEDKLNNR